jgi:Type II secretion system (T2SS), protein K
MIRPVVSRSLASQRRGGFFLVLVLVVIVVATLSVYSFTELMVAQDDAAHLAGDLVQARVNTESAAEAIRIILSQPPDARVDMGGIYNNIALFQAITVSLGDDNATPSNFSVIAPSLDEMGQLGGIRFGLQDESARLNVNTLIVLEENSSLLMPALALTSGEVTDELDTESLAVSLLMALPGMTEDVADAILDWIDEDDEARPFGAESEYYNTLPTPYSAANGPLYSVEELLLVRGVTPTLLFGVDSNRNGVVDADEQARFGMGVETPGALGWASYLTVHGAEANKKSDGTPAVKVNQEDLELLYEELTEAIGDETLASFIVAYRIAGVSQANRKNGRRMYSLRWISPAALERTSTKFWTWSIRRFPSETKLTVRRLRVI